VQSSLIYFGETTTSGIGALGFSGQALLIQLVTFLLVFAVLRKWAFKPITKVMNERRETIESGVKLGEKMQKDQAELEANIAAELNKARLEADGIVVSAQDNARDLVREAETKARVKADSIIEQAKERTAQDVARARKKLEGELVGLISDATEAIIDEKVDAKKDAALIDKALKEHASA